MFRFELTERQKEIATGAVIIGAVLVGFGLGEAAARMLQLQRFGVARSVETSRLFHSDPKTGLRLPLPSSKHGRVQINSRGFRSPEIPMPKPEGTIRLAFLGSSTTYDAYADNQSNWPHLTWRFMSEALPGCKLDYVNAGIVGLAASDSEKILRHHVAPLQPDIIVFLPSAATAALDELARKKGVHDGDHIKPSWLTQHSLLWEKIEKNIQVIRLQRGAHVERGKLQFAATEIAGDLQRGLTHFTAAALQHGRLTVLLTVPTQLDENQTPEQQLRAANTALFYKPYMSIKGLLLAQRTQDEVIKATAAKLGTVVIDVHRSVPPDAVHYADSSHFTNAGSRVMATRVSRALLEEPRLRALLREYGKGCAR